MSKTPHTLPGWVINLFFLIGLVSALAIRALIVITHIRPDLFRLVWYVGVIGYILFFLYRYRISEKRKRVIAEYGLIEKMKNRIPLNNDERDVVAYLLLSITKSRENLNYLFIFALSILAIIADIVLSL